MRSLDAIVANVDGETGMSMGTATYGQARAVGVIAEPTYAGGGWNTCAPTSDATPHTGTDESGFASYNLANLQASAIKTSVVYRRA